MGFERTIEIQRLRLLRLVAGLLALVGFLSVGPVSRSFSVLVCGFVAPILSRAEAAARYLIIAQARLIAAERGKAWADRRFAESLARIYVTDGADISLAECRARLRALRAVLMNLPRHAVRLIRRIDKQMSGALRGSLSPRPDAWLAVCLTDLQLAAIRIERPPDRGLPVFAGFELPSASGREAPVVQRV